MKGSFSKYKYEKYCPSPDIGDSFWRKEKLRIVIGMINENEACFLTWYMFWNVLLYGNSNQRTDASVFQLHIKCSRKEIFRCHCKRFNYFWAANIWINISREEYLTNSLLNGVRYIGALSHIYTDAQLVMIVWLWCVVNALISCWLNHLLCTFGKR